MLAGQTRYYYDPLCRYNSRSVVQKVLEKFTKESAYHLSGYHSVAYLKRQKKTNFIVEILTAQLVIYVNIDDDIKKHFTHEKKTFNATKKTFC